jgi:hypothetical protein
MIRFCRFAGRCGTTVATSRPFLAANRLPRLSIMELGQKSVCQMLGTTHADPVDIL